jgi:hypothetical protein
MQSGETDACDLRRNRQPCAVAQPPWAWNKLRCAVEQGRLTGASDAALSLGVELALTVMLDEGDLKGYARATLIRAGLSLADKFHNGQRAILPVGSFNTEFKVFRALDFKMTQLTPFELIQRAVTREQFNAFEYALALSMFYAAVESPEYACYDPLTLGTCVVATTLVLKRSERFAVTVRLQPQRVLRCVEFLITQRYTGINESKKRKRRALDLPSIAAKVCAHIDFLPACGNALDAKTDGPPALSA